MDQTLLGDVLRRLDEFEFKPRGDWLRQGRCPSCHKRELYTHAHTPWVLRCGRLNNCGYETHIKELYSDLFDHWSKRYPSTESSPTAAADAYLSVHRGFDLSLIKGAYTQETFYDRNLKAGTATVRFPIADTWWERLIDEPGRFKKRANFKYGGSYKGRGWLPPSVDLSKTKRLWFVEGIFDAIALTQNGHDAMALMSCNNYPSLMLDEIEKLRGGKNLSLVWALDGGNAGRRYIRQWKKQSDEEGWQSQAAYIPTNGRRELDWSDLHLLDKAQTAQEKRHLSDHGIRQYLYHGSLLVAKSATEKGLLMYQQTKLNQFEFDFGKRLYWFNLDVEKYHKAMDRIHEENGSLTQEELQEQALKESGGIRDIANCLPTPLYYQENKITDESWYYFRVEFPHDGATVKNTFTSSQVSSSPEFKKRLLAIAPGAMYTGTNSMLERSMKNQLFNIKRVETVDFIGYSKTHDAYVFGDSAVSKGVIYEANDEDYFDIGRLALKSLNQSVDLSINRDPHQYKADWVQHLITAYGSKGMAALTFWFGSLFSEQIRASQKSFPFLEIVGEAGSGKSTVIEFLWKLFGRVDYEGFDPSKATGAGRARNFSQVSGLPVVLIESDRESSGEARSNVRAFDWDELKTAYNGRSIRARGMATSGNETYEPPFRGAVVISQNNAVAGSEAIMTRIMHLTFDRSGHNAQTRIASTYLERMPVEEVSGFILAATKRTAEIMAIVEERSELYQKELMNEPEIRVGRIAKNHGQLMALADALRLVVRISDEVHAALQAQIRLMALERQVAINADHPLVDEFWDMYEYLNGDDDYEPALNHSRDSNLIALNLNHFVCVAAEAKQQIPPMRELKHLLKASRRYKYQGQRVVNSAIKGKGASAGSTSERCWIFEKRAGQ